MENENENENEETREEIREENDDTRAEVEEERARIDENAHDMAGEILDAIKELAAKIDGISEAMGAFAEFGGTVTEGDPVEFESVNGDDSIGEDLAEAIDADVITDLSNIDWD